MPYVTRARIRPLPRKPRPRAPRRSISVVPRGTGQTLAQQLGGWASIPLVYISFDGPNVDNPQWLDVTPYIDAAKGIQVTWGRSDGLSDPNASTCSLTADNSDGRWIAGNPSGTWNGLVRKGMWLRVDLLPLSGVVSRRFTGYVTALPTARMGKYSEATISASDRFFQLANAPKLQSMIVSEFLSDVAGGPYVAGYWPLHEPAGAAYALDVSGQAAAGAQALTVRSHGVTAGSGLTWSNTPAPGFDGESTVIFTPSGTPLPAVAGGNTNALPNGSYLQGTIGMGVGGVAQVTCWIKTTVAYQPIWSWSDPVNNCAGGYALDANGFLVQWQGPLSGSNFSYSIVVGTGPQSTYPLNDGVWHQISLKMQTVAATAFGPGGYFARVVDGVQTGFEFPNAPTPASGFCPPPALSRILIGAAEGWTGDTATSGLAMFTGAISDFVVHQLPTRSVNPDWTSAYAASATGHAGELTGQRLARLAAYAGLPVPQAAFIQPGSGNTATQPTTGTSAALSVGTTAHPCGPQAILGKNAPDAMRVVAHTEMTPLFVNTYGRITLQASTVRQNAPATVTITMSELEPSTSFPDDFQYTFNQAQVTPDGQGTVTVNTNGGPSQALFGVLSTSVDCVALNPAEAASLGAAVVLGSADPAPRVNLAAEVATLARVPGYGAAWYDAVLALTVSGVLAVTGWDAESPYGAGGSSTHTVEGGTETILNGTHLFAWSTSPPQAPSIVLDDPTLGVTDNPNILLAY